MMRTAEYRHDDEDRGVGLNFTYVVHSVANTKVPDTVVHEGEEITADVDALEVELMAPHDDSHGGGTLVMRFRGRRARAARETFVRDQLVTVTMAPTGRWARGREERA